MAALADRELLIKVWETHPKALSPFVTVDHKKIGARYLVTAFLFFLAGGIEALVMRTQLALPENRLLDPETYNQLFSMHGTTMIFLFATPILSGFGNYVVPLMLGARDMAFPRLNAFTYWVFLFSGLFIYASFLIGSAPDGGWFAYTPLSGKAASPGPGLDFWALGLVLLGISTTAGALNFIVSILKVRAPGMSVDRLPLFIWNVLVTALAVIFALPALTLACLLLELDRNFGTHFFDPAAGGSALLWQHLFWFFGHPDVYIIFLPAVGIVSSVVPVFSRRPMVGHTFVALATVTTGVLSFGVWLHHMFATGLPPIALSFFGVVTTLIAVPAGVQIIAWITTMWSGRPVWRTPLMFAAGFIVLFLIGGLTGVMFAVVPFDQQITDSYFVVAHFHYVLFGGAVFPIFAGLYYWLPKMTGRLMNDRFGQVNFWLMFTGFNLTFMPMHIVGMLGMPRRVYTYPTGLGWDGTNLAETVGAFLLGVGILAFIANFLWSLKAGEPAGPNPWFANTLEWATSSPPEDYNFEVMPTVAGRDPLWDTHDELGRPILARPRALQRETLGTELLEAIPQNVLNMPQDTPLPFVLAFCLAVLFVGLLLQQIALCLLAGLASIVVVGAWLWPGKEAQA